MNKIKLDELENEKLKTKRTTSDTMPPYFNQKLLSSVPRASGSNNFDDAIDILGRKHCRHEGNGGIGVLTYGKLESCLIFDDDYRIVHNGGTLDDDWKHLSIIINSLDFHVCFVIFKFDRRVIIKTLFEDFFNFGEGSTPPAFCNQTNGRKRSPALVDFVEECVTKLTEENQDKIRMLNTLKGKIKIRFVYLVLKYGWDAVLNVFCAEDNVHERVLNMTNEQFKTMHVIDVKYILRRSAKRYGSYLEEVDEDADRFVRRAENEVDARLAAAAAANNNTDDNTDGNTDDNTDNDTTDNTDDDTTDDDDGFVAQFFWERIVADDDSEILGLFDDDSTVTGSNTGLDLVDSSAENSTRSRKDSTDEDGANEYEFTASTLDGDEDEDLQSVAAVSEDEEKSATDDSFEGYPVGGYSSPSDSERDEDDNGTGSNPDHKNEDDDETGSNPTASEDRSENSDDGLATAEGGTGGQQTDSENTGQVEQESPNDEDKRKEYRKALLIGIAARTLAKQSVEGGIGEQQTDSENTGQVEQESPNDEDKRKEYRKALLIGIAARTLAKQSVEGGIGEQQTDSENTGQVEQESPNDEDKRKEYRKALLIGIAARTLAKRSN